MHAWLLLTVANLANVNTVLNPVLQYEPNSDPGAYPIAIGKASIRQIALSSTNCANLARFGSFNPILTIPLPTSDQQAIMPPLPSSPLATQEVHTLLIMQHSSLHSYAFFNYTSVCLLLELPSCPWVLKETRVEGKKSTSPLVKVLRIGDWCASTLSPPSAHQTRNMDSEFLEAKKSYSLSPSVYLFVFIPRSLTFDT